MSSFESQRLGLVMEPEPGNSQEVEGVLNPAAARGPMAIFICSHGWSREGITRVSALQECGSMLPAIP